MPFTIGNKLEDSKNLAAPGDPQLRISCHPLAAPGAVHRFLHPLFDFPQTFRSELHDDLVEISGGNEGRIEICENRVYTRT